MISHEWYKNSRWLGVFRPLSSIFLRVAVKRRNQYLSGEKNSWKSPVPVVVVGNITVGGVGKTPLVVFLASYFVKNGIKVGIVSRGYGAKTKAFPLVVTADSNASRVGDEPLLLARLTNCPVVIDPDRPSAASKLLQDYPVDLIISDDGMQHYALQRDLEIAVVDGQRGIGNGRCLPEGPLREPVERLDSVDWVIVNGELTAHLPWQGEFHSMRIEPVAWVNVATGDTRALDFHWPQGVNAVVGIGNPQRFFQTLDSLGLSYSRHIFADHYPFKENDLAFADGKEIIMTEKDAVKCQAFAGDNCWFLKVEARLETPLLEEISKRVGQLTAKSQQERH